MAFLAIFLVGATSVAAPASPPVRVALMDFSTDDNSWRNAEAAANFTSLVQIRLADEPGVEWIERAQLELARQELKLSEMELLGGASPIRRGKWAKADWLIKGRFSTDDKTQRTVSFEVIDLQHADVLASQTLVFPGKATLEIQPAPDQVQLAARTLRHLLAEAHHRRQETEGQVAIAPLFLVNLTPFGRSGGEEVLEPEFYAALERAAATNRHLRLIRFPKAYQSMDESEMVLDGLVEADPQAWLHTADLYVWGTYAVTNSSIAGTYQSKLEIILHVWDGVSPPEKFRNAVPLSGDTKLSSGRLAAVLDRMVEKISARAHQSQLAPDSLAARREIAESIAQTYRQFTGPMHPQLGLQDDDAFVQAVHMLETACFFDPDNADLHAMRISCRWGWWMDFGFKLKNPFWSYWRRSQAWGWYVDRFGLQPAATPLPFPFQMQGLSGIYVGSQQEALRRFPQRYEPDDEQQQAAGVHTDVKEAQAHGFPKDIPRDVVLKWKAEVEAELAERKKKAAAFAQSAAASAQSTAMTPPASVAPSLSNQPPTSSPNPALPASASPSARKNMGPSPWNQIVPAPGWFKEIRPQYNTFSLSPPAVLSSELKPAVQVFRFPGQFEVRGVLQMALWQGKLLILAMDERSAPSSDAHPDLAAEVISQRARLWSLDPSAQSPTLFEAGLLPDNVHSFLLDQDQLWVASASLGCLDLKSRTFRPFGLRDGLASGPFHSLAFAGDRLFATGDVFKLYTFEPGSSQWQQLSLPPAKLSTGTGFPSLVSGNRRWLGYVSGAALLYDVPAAGWTNLPDMAMLQCVAADASGFWFGGFEGLNRYDLDSQTLSSMRMPTSIRGLTPFSMGPYQYIGQPRIPQEAVTRISESIEQFLKTLQKERIRVHLDRAEKKNAVDPLHLDWRLPGQITALAHDGDFLWIGTGRSSRGRLLLVHKPSLSLVGYCLVDGDVSSLAMTENDVWVGTSYGKELLTRIDKRPLISIPRSRWLNFAITPDQRTRLVSTLSSRDQAVYAFYSGEDARVVELLRNINPDKATLEEMFLLAFACDTSGVDRPESTRAWFGRIISRYPDSPWATAAREFLATNDQNHKVKQRQALLLARYDRNHDGVLDKAERRAMELNPAYQREESTVREDQLATRLREIIKKYDRNGDGRLDQDELEPLRSAVRVFAEAPPEMLAGRKILVAPLLTKDFPTTAKLLKQYDTNKDGALDASELRALANDVQKSR